MRFYDESAAWLFPVGRRDVFTGNTKLIEEVKLAKERVLSTFHSRTGLSRIKELHIVPWPTRGFWPANGSQVALTLKTELELLCAMTDMNNLQFLR